MQILLKKLAYIFLTLCLTTLSAQATLVESVHKCDTEKTTEQNHLKTFEHCQHQSSQQTCSCSDCACNLHITTQADLFFITKAYLHSLTVFDTLLEISHQYSQHFFNPLLPPPII